MSELVTQSSIQTMNEDDIAHVQSMEDYVGQLEQIEITTWHTLHAGMYTRTVLLPKGTVTVGALIKRNVCLIVSGHVVVSLGNDGSREYTGYNCITAQANRKQAFIAKEDTYLTMYFPTEAKTIKEAEDEFTDDGDKLVSRHELGINHITITGE